MKRFALATAVLSVASALTLRSRPVVAQDAAVVDAKHCKVLVDNAYVRVLEFNLPPGAKDPVHTHAAGVYVVTEAGKMRVTPVGKKADVWEPKPGETAWMDAEGAHGSENVGPNPFSFILVEVKNAAAAR